MPNLKHNLWNSLQNPPRKYIIFYAQKNFSKKTFFRLKKIAFCKKSLTHHLAREYVPLPHVFPPFAIRQSPTGRATLGSRTFGDVVSLCHLSLWCKKNRAHQRLRTNSGARRSLPRRRCSSRSVTQQVSACIRSLRTGIHKLKKTASAVFFNTIFYLSFFSGFTQRLLRSGW